MLEETQTLNPDRGEVAQLFSSGNVEIRPDQGKDNADIFNPDNLDTVLTQVTLKKGEITNEDAHYCTMWNMFFVDKNWFYYEDNKRKLPKIFPAFAVVEMESPFFKNMQQINMTEDQQAKNEYFHKMFRSNYLILPFKNLKADTPLYYFSDRFEIEFVGAKFNMNSTRRWAYFTNNCAIKVCAVCAYGYYYTPKEFRSDLDVITNRRTATAYGSLNKPTDSDSEIPKGIINLYQKCEEAIFNKYIVD